MKARWPNLIPIMALRTVICDWKEHVAVAVLAGVCACYLCGQLRFRYGRVERLYVRPELPKVSRCTTK